ncbi:MAG: hypothetical protein ACSHXD_14775 [Marinosulfonomonas sp.]
MLSKSEKSRLLFQTIGWPIGTGAVTPTADALEQLTEFAFKSRVGLLFLEECLRKGVKLGPAAEELHRSLTKRRKATDGIIVKLTRKLDQVAKGEWVLFKSIKPFSSTPNDTDWFPLEPKRHKELCDHLQADGEFTLLEVAPRQTTLIESSGADLTDTTKKGGVYYIDCYVAPSTDYFVYLDPRRLRAHTDQTEVMGETVPILAPYAELAAIMFHNIFPEKSFSIESYYLVKRYLDLIEAEGSLDHFVDVCRDQKMEFAAVCNLAAVAAIDTAQFNDTDTRITALLHRFEMPEYQLAGFDANGAFPYEFSNKVFWRTFASKQRDRTSFLSTLNQALHMLNPVFFADVVRIIWRRCIKGGVYEQN